MKYDKALGALWGLLVGDCLGSPIQFTDKDGHPHVTEMLPCGHFGTPPGHWTDDGSMALCVAESVGRLGRFDRADVGRNFVRWLRDGFLSSMPSAFDVGGATWRSVSAIESSGSLENGTEDSQGNGSVMRLAPSWIAARACGKPEILRECSDLTHRSRRVRQTVERMAGILDELAAKGATAAVSAYATREDCNNSGWCVSTLECALWALNTTSTFEDALVAAVNLGGDADTIGAVCGQLAGAKYGFSAIPERWLAAIKDRGKIAAIFDRFLAALGIPGRDGYPRPALAADIVAIRPAVHDGRGDGEILLVRRGGEPFKGAFALPGGFLQPGESLEECARRELKEETGPDVESLMALPPRSAPGRDPRGWVVSCPFLCVVAPDAGGDVRGGDDAAEAAWVPLGAVPSPLAFDHGEILADALVRLRPKSARGGG